MQAWSVIFGASYGSVTFGASYGSVTFGASRRSVTFEPAYRSVIFGATSSVLPLCGNPPSPEGKAKGTPPLRTSQLFRLPAACSLLPHSTLLIPHSSLLTPHSSFLIPNSCFPLPKQPPAAHGLLSPKNNVINKRKRGGNVEISEFGFC